MRVGILTFHNTNNYGAELQAFALSTVIRKMGHDVELIDYRNPSVSEGETPKMPSLKQLIRHPRSSFLSMTTYHHFVQRHNSFSCFRKQYEMRSPLVCSQQEMESRYDAVIVGSDQVWNPEITGNDLTYFLTEADSSKVRKIAYAASFGYEAFPRTLYAPCSKALADFHAISVREKSGLSIVESLCGRKARQVLDPTLLLDTMAWQNAACSRIEDGDYVFAYIVAEHEKALAYARSYAREHKMKLLVSECYSSIPSLHIRNNKSSASPEEFLSLIQHARLVVTSSFHGLALALSLGTDVRFSLVSEDKQNKNSRLTSLAELAGVEDCAISASTRRERIDFQAVDAKLAQARKASLAYLQDSLSAKGRS